ncbi:unnamed protein product [Amoebophrya sp. A120]|nr:unnamed protein product [Amoebophrya sp. A120]|eukprot:GSA120T00022908001.1
MTEENAFYGVFFTCYIIAANFMMMSLFIGVLVDTLTAAANTADLTLIQSIRENQLKMSQELTEVFHKVDADGSGSVTVEEFKNAVKSSKALMQKVTNLHVQEEELEWLFRVLDTDGSGELSVDEFVSGILLTRDSEMSSRFLQLENTLLREIRGSFQTALKNSGALMAPPVLGPPAPEEQMGGGYFQAPMSGEAGLSKKLE